LNYFSLGENKNNFNQSREWSSLFSKKKSYSLFKSKDFELDVQEMNNSLRQNKPEYEDINYD
jgi:hypothetical protein